MKDEFGGFSIIKSSDDDVFLSVLLSSFNAEKYLSRCLASIVSNKFSSYELVVIDDGSEDDSGSIIRSYLSLMPHYQLIVQSNIGLTKSLIRGVGLCRGKFVMRLDADDVMSFDRMQNAFNDYKKYNFDIRFSKVKTFGGVEKQLPRSIYQSQDPRVIFNLLRFGNFLVHGSLMIRTDILKQNNYSQDCVVAQDFDLYCRLIPIVNKIIFSREVEYFLNINDESISAKRSAHQTETQKIVAQRTFKGVDLLVSSDKSFIYKFILKFLRVFYAIYHCLFTKQTS